MIYGLPYQGSKSNIADWVVSYLPPSHTLMDVFAGGCAVTHAALLSDKFERVVANDKGDGPQVFLDAINGEFEGYCSVPTREEFFERKDDDFALALLYSFGNDGNTYLWGTEREDVKLHASRMISLPSIHERRMEYRLFIKSLMHWLAVNGPEDPEKPDGLKRLDGLERLKRLNGLDGLRESALTITKLDYRDIEVPDGATVYADPPYKRSLCDKALYGGGFRYGGFEAWLASVEFPVIVSEYDCPSGCVELAATEKTMTMNDKMNTTVTERLFVQERFEGEYRRRMERVGLFAEEGTR